MWSAGRRRQSHFRNAKIKTVPLVNAKNVTTGHGFMDQASLTSTMIISKIGEVGKTIMDRSPIFRHIIALGIAGAIILPIAICLILAVASLLSAMGDMVGGGVLRWVALACGIVWVLDLILLVLALAVNALRESEDSDTHES
jgi:hypothetical protein